MSGEWRRYERLEEIEFLADRRSNNTLCCKQGNWLAGWLAGWARIEPGGFHRCPLELIIFATGYGLNLQASWGATKDGNRTAKDLFGTGQAEPDTRMNTANLFISRKGVFLFRRPPSTAVGLIRAIRKIRAKN